MTPAEKQQLKAVLVATSLYYGHEIPDPALRLFVEDLADLDFQAVYQAIGQLRRDPKITRCPLPAVIRAKLTPESDPESEAVMITGRIMRSIARIGPYDTARAKAEIGPVGWRVVEMEGGWEHVCNAVDDDNSGMFKAQWRNLAKALINRGDTGERQEALPAPGLIDIRAMLPKFPGESP